MSPAARGLLRQVPDALTVTRALLAVAFPFLPEGWRLPALLAALASEYLDGFLARALDAQSRFGRLCDPAADKLFFASVAITYVAQGRLGLVALLLLSLRDVGVLAGLAWMALRRRWKSLAELRPFLAGKVATALQYAAMLWLVTWDRVPPWLVALVALASVAAGLQYLRAARGTVHRELVA